MVSKARRRLCVSYVLIVICLDPLVSDADTSGSPTNAQQGPKRARSEDPDDNSTTKRQKIESEDGSPGTIELEKHSADSRQESPSGLNRILKDLVEQMEACMKERQSIVSTARSQVRT